MLLPIITDPTNTLMEDILVNEILDINEKSKEYGLFLKPVEVKGIIENRNRILQSYGRVELGIEGIKNFIQNFCDSPFISQENYISTLQDLHEVFYYLKNETEDRIGDEELIRIIKEYFNGSCGGSLELLRGRELEAFIRNYKAENPVADFLGERGE